MPNQNLDKREKAKENLIRNIQMKNIPVNMPGHMKQPFGKRLDQKTTFYKKVGPKNNHKLLSKACKYIKAILIILTFCFFMYFETR